jgi:hypothetical protein
MKPYYYTPKVTCKFVLHTLLSKPIKEVKYKDTIYALYSVDMLQYGNDIPIPGKHILMLPVKTAWQAVYKAIKEEHLEKKKGVCILLSKNDNFHYTAICVLHPDNTTYCIRNSIYEDRGEDLGEDWKQDLEEDSDDKSFRKEDVL